MARLKELNWIRLFALVFCIAGFCTPPSEAAFRVTVTGGETFKEAEITRMAVATVECADLLDCAAIERKIHLEILKMKLELTIVPEERVRKLLFEKGHTEYTPDLRPWIAEELEVDAIIELRVPFGAKGDGPYGRRGSEAKVELSVVRPGGEILLHGVGTGRPKNVVTSPERVAGNIVERILKKAFE